MVPLAVPSCREVQRPTLTAPPCALPAAMFDSTFSSKCTLSMPCLILDPDLARTSSIWVKLCRQGTCYGIAAVMMLFLVWGALVLLLESRTSAAQILFSVLLPWSFILATALFLGQQGIVRQVKSRPTHTCVRLVLRGTFVRCPWRSMRRNPNASMTKALKITLKTWEHDPPLYQCALTHSSRTWKSMTTQWIRPFTR
jgi:hypothetical protein